MVCYHKTWISVAMSKPGRPEKRRPSYLLHKASGQAIAKWKKETVYLGPYDSSESYAAYAKVLALFDATGKIKEDYENWTVAQACDAYLSWYADEYPMSSREHGNIRSGIDDLLKTYGALPIVEFSPIDLASLRKGWIDRDLSRKTVVKYHFFCLRIFKHALTIGYLPSENVLRLLSVPTVKKAQGKAREPERITPVDRKTVDATLPHLSRHMRAMVELQWHTGMRPSEVCSISWDQIDMSADVWWYNPDQHKKKSRGRLRYIGIGPKGQAVLNEFRHRPPAAAIFSAAESAEERSKELRAKRKTKVQPSQQNRAKGVEQADFYLANGYKQAIVRACRKGDIEPWTPNRIRHTFGTVVRRDFGLDHAQAVLGHDHAKTTEIYADVAKEKIIEVIRRIG